MAKEKKVSEKADPCKGSFDLSKIDAALLNIKKDLGDDCIIDIDTIPEIPRVACKSPSIGYVFGRGGTPEGRIIELYGPESSGKSLIAQNIGADFQNAGKFVAYVDAEYSFDPKYAHIQGLSTSPDKFKLLQPNCGEDAFTVVERLAESGQVGLVIVDSVSALIPKAELEGEMTDSQMGAQARMMGKGLRKITAIIAKNNCTVIFINQIRMKIGVMFGSPETTSGGQALKFFASIRCEVRASETTAGAEDGDDALGILTRFKNIKNKTSISKRKCELFFSFTDGIDVYGEYVDFGVSMGFIQKGGAWYTVEGARFQGRTNAIKGLKEDTALFTTIKSKVDAKLSGDPTIKVELPITEDVKPKSLAELAAE